MHPMRDSLLYAGGAPSTRGLARGDALLEHGTASQQCLRQPRGNIALLDQLRLENRGEPALARKQPLSFPHLQPAPGKILKGTPGCHLARVLEDFEQVLQHRRLAQVEIEAAL